MLLFNRKDKDIIRLIDKEYESLVIGLSKWYSDQIEELRRLFAMKGYFRDSIIKSEEYRVLISFVKKQAEAYCETILKYHTNPNRYISESNKNNYKIKLEDILSQINEDIQSVNIVKDQARCEFESIYSKVNYDTSEDHYRNRKETFNKIFIGVSIGVIGSLLVYVANLIYSYVKS